MLKFNSNYYADWTGPRHEFNYSRGDYADARRELQEVPIAAEGSVQQMWDTNKDRVICPLNGHVPIIRIRRRKWRSNYPHDKEVLDLIRRRSGAIGSAWLALMPLKGGVHAKYIIRLETE